MSWPTRSGGPGRMRSARPWSRWTSETGDPEHQVSDDAPVIAVAGVAARPSAGVETIRTEGAALDMARTSKRKNSTPESALDWTERTLDRGESDELRARPPRHMSRVRPGRRRMSSGPCATGGIAAPCITPDFDRHRCRARER